MAANTISIAEELLQSISLHQMRAIPAYLSETDSVTTWDFAKSELSEKYVLDTENLYWPGTVNRSHVFDIFAEFLPHRDSGKTRLDMINFVSENKERYQLDGHVVLKMHETNLNAWACKMTYWENSADELALYALSDLTKAAHRGDHKHKTLEYSASQCKTKRHTRSAECLQCQIVVPR